MDIVTEMYAMGMRTIMKAKLQDTAQNSLDIFKAIRPEIITPEQEATIEDAIIESKLEFGPMLLVDTYCLMGFMDLLNQMRSDLIEEIQPITDADLLKETISKFFDREKDILQLSGEVYVRSLLRGNFTMNEEEKER